MSGLGVVLAVLEYHWFDEMGTLEALSERLRRAAGNLIKNSLLVDEDEEE